MKKLKKFVSILCAVSMILAASASAFAADIMPRVEDGRMAVQEDLSGNRPTYEFTVREGEKYFRVAVRNDLTDKKLTVKVYEGDDLSSALITMEADPGKWTPNTSYKGTPGTSYTVVVSAPEGFNPAGVIRVRVSSTALSRNV